MRVQLAVSAPQMLLGAKFRPAQKGADRLRQDLTARLAMQAAFGRSSPFYNDLYRAGLLGRSYSCGAQFCGPVALAMLGGESREPDAVYARVRETAARITRDGFDPAAFERVRRAMYGKLLCGLDQFRSVCIDMAEITAAECAAWLTETFAPERLALSVVTPKGGDGDADDDA